MHTWTKLKYMKCMFVCKGTVCTGTYLYNVQYVCAVCLNSTYYVLVYYFSVIERKPHSGHRNHLNLTKVIKIVDRLTIENQELHLNCGSAELF